MQRLAERRGHHIEPGHRIVIGLVDPLVGAIPVHRVGDQGDGALVVVHRGDIGGQQQQHVGQPEIVDGDLREPFEPAHHVVGEVAHQTRGQRRQAGHRGGGQQFQRAAQRRERVTAGRRVLRCDTQPDRRAVTHRQRRRRARADERPPRPGAPVLRRFQQERAGPVGGQLAVGRQRCLTVGEHLAGHRDHPVPGGEFPEILTWGGDGQRGGRGSVLHADNPPRRPPGGGRSVGDRDAYQDR